MQDTVYMVHSRNAGGHRHFYLCLSEADLKREPGEPTLQRNKNGFPINTSGMTTGEVDFGFHP